MYVYDVFILGVKSHRMFHVYICISEQFLMLSMLKIDDVATRALNSAGEIWS